MDTRQWLNELETELFQRRLPRRYVTRLVRELSDHVLDDREKVMSTDAPMLPGAVERLGLPRTVAVTAEREFQRRRFAVRHPAITFALCPLLLLPVLVLAFFAGPGFILEAVLPGIGPQEFGYSPWAPILAQGYVVACILLASVLVVAAFSGLAARCSVSRRWPLTTAIVAAVLCGCLWTNATPKTPEKLGTVVIGIPGSWRRPTVFQLIQFVVPLAVAACMVRGNRPERDGSPGAT
jgi:hypothetical protein